VPILDSTFRRTTSARRPSKSTVPPRRAASSASSYFIPVGLPSSVISTVYQRPVRKVLRPGLYRAPAFIVLLAALLLSSLSWRGRSLCALEALRRTLGGATMTIPGGVSTPRKACHNFPVLGASASIMGSELQPPALLLALIHRSACKANSPKLNFRFTEFSEVRAREISTWHTKIGHVGDVLWPALPQYLGCYSKRGGGLTPFFLRPTRERSWG
jgi:hypothetical protein